MTFRMKERIFSGDVVVIDSVVRVRRPYVVLDVRPFLCCVSFLSSSWSFFFFVLVLVLLRLRLLDDQSSFSSCFPSSCLFSLVFIDVLCSVKRRSSENETFPIA